MDWLALLTAFGVGSIVTAAVQYWLETRHQARVLRFHERKEAYLGLLEAWVRQEDEAFSERSKRDVGHWLLRAQLVASKKVAVLLKAWEGTEPGSTDRIAATERLKAGMRDDLLVS